MKLAINRSGKVVEKPAASWSTTRNYICYMLGLVGETIQCQAPPRAWQLYQMLSMGSWVAQ